MSSEEPSTPKPRSIQLIEDRWANVRHIAEAIAIVAAGLWAFYVFVYQEDIKPAHEPAALVLSISIHRLGRDARHEILLVGIDYRNVGKTEIDIAADGFDLWGIRYASHIRPRALFSKHGADIYNDVPEVSRSLIRASMELRARARNGDPRRHIIIEPGATESVDTTVVLPRGAYDALQALVIAVPAKTSANGKLNITITRPPQVGLWLGGSGNWDEDDDRTDFALVP